jgi:hypothetical protein
MIFCLVAMMFLSLSCSSGWTAAWVYLVHPSLLGVRCLWPLGVCPILGSGIWLHLLWVLAKMRTAYSWLLLAMLVWLGILLMCGDTRLVQVVFLICRHCALLLLGLVGLIETCWADNLIELCCALVGYAIGCCSCLTIPIGLLLWWWWWLYRWCCRW